MSGKSSALTAADVAKHNTKEDCWVIINGHVWNVTDWLDKHPGGSQAIFEFAGQDASIAYNGKHPANLVSTKLPSSSHIGQLAGSDSLPRGLPTPASSGLRSRPDGNGPVNNNNPTQEGEDAMETEQPLLNSTAHAKSRADDYAVRMAHGWTVYDGTYDPVPQDKRRKRDVPYPSWVQHTFRSRAGLSNLQLSHNAPISLCSIDVAVSHIWQCMPGNARRYLHIPPPNGPALWSDNEKAVAAMYEKIDDSEYHIPLVEDPDILQYRGYVDMKRRPWIIWPLWIEDRWGSGWVTVISYSENTDETPSRYTQLISYSIIDPRRSPDADGNGRHGPVRDRIERIQNRLLDFYRKAGIDTSAAEYKEVLCSPMPFEEVTSGERCFAVVKELVNQVIDWYTSGRNFCKVGTIKNMKRWVNPFQERVELTGINAWILMASLDYDARITVETMLTNTLTEVAADGVKKYLHPYDLAGPFDESPLSASDYFLPPDERYKTKEVISDTI